MIHQIIEQFHSCQYQEKYSVKSIKRIKQQSEEFTKENQYEFRSNRGTIDGYIYVR